MPTITKNNTGIFRSIVKVATKPTPSFPKQKYVPDQYLWDDELKEWVSFYWLSRNWDSDASGAQCFWLDNNAQVNNSDEFGIKITSQNLGESKAKSAAFAMYQRQRLAAEEGLAPPVHGMCCFRYYNKVFNEVRTYWGYLSCRADTESIEMDNDVRNEFDEYYREQQYKWQKLDEVESLLYDMGVGSAVLNNIKEDIGEHPDSLDFHDWCLDNEREEYYGFDDLKESLQNLSICGLQNDYRPIGETYACCRGMDGDLHSRNIAMWNGDLVSIDFGYHCVE